jgi:hypothetical protein
MNNYSGANHYQLAPSKPQDAINQESYEHILSVLSEAHQVTYGDSVVTNDHCQHVRLFFMPVFSGCLLSFKILASS